MYAISKEFAFSASHVLDGLPPDHQCGRLHGHNIVVRVTLASDTLDEVGFVLDYGALAPLKDHIDASFDHRHLNDMVDFNPTAENFCHYLYTWCERLGWPVQMVEWSETPKTWASFSRRPA